MNYLPLKLALNPTFLRVKVTRLEIDKFKENFTDLLQQTNNNLKESEEFHKNNLREFLQKTYYQPNYYLNTKEKDDLVIYNGHNSNSNVAVIIETKNPNNKLDLPSQSGINVKSLQQLLYYYLVERITYKNINIQHLIITNIYDWFIFPTNIFEQLFIQNKQLIKQFNDFQEKRLSIQKREDFYKLIAKSAIEKVEDELKKNCAYFNLKNYQNVEDKELIPIYKLLSPTNLLNESFLNDSNTLDEGFYHELLHIIGLVEVEKNNQQFIERLPANKRNYGSLLENAINKIDSLDGIYNLKTPEEFGENYEEQLFNIALELVILWVNRILFLKLLEAQLINYNKQQSLAFLDIQKIQNFDDLNILFFEILAKQNNNRNVENQDIFNYIPYLNSSLFDIAEIERKTIVISNLKQDINLPIYNNTILKDYQGKKQKGKLNTLEYLFEFLKAYDFSSEGSEDIQEENKTLINASVLGLIFEKINGYKDGAFFTPGYITMYICRETISRVIIQKFNQIKGWHCKNLFDLKNNLDRNLETIKEGNSIINSIKICDPSVGSGHFLVSALNEILAIKSELKLLATVDYHLLTYLQIKVVNDELVIIDETGNLFEYNPNNEEKQLIQETLFHEKQTIIENCLFGVDINPKSVKICQLRLWIELLKHTYYIKPSLDTRGDTLGQKRQAAAKISPPELQIFPNIDINIKWGNSLINRFKLDADLKGALKKNNLTIHDYKNTIKTYHNPKNKQEKRQITELIQSIKENFKTAINSNHPLLNQLRDKEGELEDLTNQITLLEETIKEKKAREKQIKLLEKEINFLSNEIEDSKNNQIYNKALEWRFEFPEVLNNEGDFIGFDAIIGNPPYIRQEKILALKPLLEKNYQIYNSTSDLLTYFVELGFNLLSENGILSLIISNKFTRANYGQKIREFLLANTKITHFIDLSNISVFNKANVDTAILAINKNKNSQENLLYAKVRKNEFDIKFFNNYIDTIKQDFNQDNLNKNAWIFAENKVLKIKEKIDRQGIPLKNWDIKILGGIITGYNQAFTINGDKRKELIEKDANSANIIKPLLRGRDVQKYYVNFQDLWLINLHNGYTKNKEKFAALKVEDYPAIKEYLDQFYPQLVTRLDQGITPYNLRSCAYISEFEKPKIIYKDIAQKLTFTLDKSNYYINNSNYMMVGNFDLSYLTATLNSSLFNFYYQLISTILGQSAVRLFTQFVEQIPVKKIGNLEEKEFKNLVTKIMKIKAENSSANISDIERKIDQLIYQLYDLTEEEINIIETENI